MKYVLNLSKDNRILSAAYQIHQNDRCIVVDSLPDGNVLDYQYENGKFIYAPLPAPEVLPTPLTTEERIADLEAALDMLLSGVTE